MILLPSSMRVSICIHCKFMEEYGLRNEKLKDKIEQPLIKVPRFPLSFLNDICQQDLRQILGLLGHDLLVSHYDIESA